MLVVINRFNDRSGSFLEIKEAHEQTIEELLKKKLSHEEGRSGGKPKNNKTPAQEEERKKTLASFKL